MSIANGGLGIHCQSVALGRPALELASRRWVTVRPGTVEAARPRWVPRSLSDAVQPVGRKARRPTVAGMGKLYQACATHRSYGLVRRHAHWIKHFRGRRPAAVSQGRGALVPESLGRHERGNRVPRWHMWRTRSIGLAVVPGDVADAADGWAGDGGVVSVMVVEVEPAGKAAGALAV